MSFSQQYRDSSNRLANDKAIDWIKLSSNPKAIELLLENPDRIVWDEFSKNPNDKAIEILKEYQDKII
jgi:hypothetical protein